MNHPTDKELDDYLSRRSDVSARYRDIEADDVPPALDAAVLSKARDAIKATPSALPKRRPTWVRWSAPLALAASAVLVVAIVLEVGLQDEVRLPAARMEQGVAASDVAKREAAPAPLEEEVVADVIERPIDSLPPPAPAAAPFAEAPAPPSVSNELSAAGASKPTASASEQERLVANRAVSGAIAPQQQPAAAREVRKEEAAASESKEAAEAIIVTARSRQESLQDVPMSVEEIAVQAAPRQQPAFGPRAPVAPAARRATAPSAADSSLAEEMPFTTPEVWLEAIRKLRAEGKNAEADESWRQFVAAYPDFEVSARDTARPKR